MADVAPAGVEKSLDDFFAKRDKKKKKEKGKGKEQVTGAAAAAAMPVKKMKKEKEKSTKSENQDAQMEKEDEEWKEFEQKEVDYTGLRLQAMQMSDEKEEEEYEKEEVGEDGEIILVTSDKMSGPWNKSGGAPPSAASAPVEEVEVPEPKAPGVYRPPGARLTTTKKAPAQGPPEIFSDAQFPSLLSTARHVETRKDREMEKTFEVVKHKSRVREGEGPGSMQQLQLDNQYAILGDK
ncbi:protein CDV3 homolog [Danio rerio]|uniref:Protein CDV3 homolog n=1 Tax=Danio rerio TaxID=7955 RepID=CDV3_DANRE|nr:protein CDV3 homolog [Danio rerio]Q7T370.1 RecName: Full=Protein CDV3 homolog [Danio rerio]AAH53231.1 Carnitine deficiency-associated gene expressed in ventricle 3 [Danio rerio]|eukprot:NP_997886.1 protein CDV3 homolog [Danio rerio]